MTIFLHVTRSSGPTEKLRVEADGDTVHVPHHFLTSPDVLGLDVEVEETEGGWARDDRAAASAGGTGDATPGAQHWVPGVYPGVSSPHVGAAARDPFFRLLDEIGWHVRRLARTGEPV